MAWFRKRPTPPAGPVIVDPFAVVPIKPDNVEVRRDHLGHIHLRLQLELHGLKKRVAERFGYDYSRKIELDEYGTLYFSLINGVNNLGAIVNQLMAQTKKNRQEVEEAVILFTKKLMTLNYIVLEVPKP